MTFRRTAALALCGLLHACAPQARAPLPAFAAADLVFRGAHILTVDASTRSAGAVAVRGERISAVGTPADIEPLIDGHTRVVELGERALVPGFIDGHGHLALVMQTLDFVDVSSPPVGSVERIADVVSLLTERIQRDAIPAGQWVIGFGYDDSLLAEGRHPDRDDLDRASTEHPIALLHVSGHLAAVNSAGLAAAGIGPDTPDPEGGVIRRRPGSPEPNGVLEETAAMGIMGRAMAEGSGDDFADELLAAIDYYASFGITTIQDGASSPQFVAALRAVAARKPLAVDVAAYPHADLVSEDLDLDAVGYTRRYTDGVRVAGVKFVLDGSPQGRTAWLTEPYTEGPPGAPADYVAYPVMDPDRYLEQSARLIAAGIPIIVHANGDAAIDLMIDGVENALIQIGGDTPPDHRSVAIHAQLAREDQLDRMRALGITPSYFAAHPYFWGDWHRRSFGDARASRISPLRSTIDRGMPFNIHNDTPVVPPHMLRLIEIAVTRKTRSGHVLGPEQRVSVEEALYAVTLGAAYAYFEEDQKGSITPGKRADLVVLERDPRSVAPDEISEIEVLETFARGRSVYTKRPPS